MNGGTIETARLRLEPWDEAHTRLLVELSSDPQVVRHIGTGEPWSPELAERVSREQRNHWAEQGFGWRAAVERAGEEAVGFSALNLLGDETKGLEATEIEIGWWLKPSAWGRGLAVEGAKAMLDEAFGRLEAPSVGPRPAGQSGLHPRRPSTRDDPRAPHRGALRRDH